MLEKLEQLSQEVSNIIIYTNSAQLQAILSRKIKDRFKIERSMTKYADNSASLKLAKSESLTPPFGGGMWCVDVQSDNIPIKDLTKALAQISYAAVNVYWVTKYAVYKKIIDLDVVQKQGVFCFTMYTGRLNPEDISYIHKEMLPKEKWLSKELLNYLKKNYTYDVDSVCKLFDKIKNEVEVKTTSDIIKEVGIGGNTIESFLIKLLTANPKTEKGLKKIVENMLLLIDDLSYSYNYDTLRNFIRSNLNTIMEIKQLQVMGKFSNVIKDIPEEGFNEDKIKRLRRFERVILEDINIARVLKLKLIFDKYNSYNAEIDLIQSVYCFLTEIMESNMNNPESKEFTGKKRRRKI